MTSLQRRKDVTSYQRELLAMRMKLANWTRLAVVVVVVTGTQTGCKSGWKMPGSDMFSWSRKPSESTLAGSSPSLSMPSSSQSGPISPASRNTPSTLASSAANGRGPTSSTGPSFNMPPNSATAAMGGAGTAASANGYTNGPYGMVGNQTRPGGYSAPSGYGAPTGYTAPSTGLAQNAPTGYKPASGTAPTGFAPTTSSLASSPPSLPPAYGAPSAGMGQLPNSAPAYPSFANNTVPALPASFNPGATSQVATQSHPPTSMPNALPSSYQPSMPSIGTQPSVATQQYNGAAPYRPGSVGRPTGYDFSTQGQAGFASPTPPAPAANGLPPAVPSTANGNGLPSPTYR